MFKQTGRLRNRAKTKIQQQSIVLALLFRQTSNIIVSWNLNNNLQKIFHRLCQIKSWDKYKSLW